MSRALCVLASIVLLSSGAVAQTSGPAAGSETVRTAGAVKQGVPYVDVKRVLETLGDRLPAELRAKAPAEVESLWPVWVARRNEAIRARLERGDEDSIVNLWLYGTTFTDLPPARERDIAKQGGRVSTAEILQGRLTDLAAGIASPGTNERLRFARHVIDRKGIDPATPMGRDQLRRFLVETRQRVLAEYEVTDHVIESAREAARLLADPSAEVTAYSAIFHDRGLSSDTSMLASFAVEQALNVIKSDGVLDSGSVRRVAIVGPGLDFIGKADGYDFYPQQTIQPFAIIDSLRRLGLATPGELRVTTFDVNPRVNLHLDAVRERARGGEPYVVHLPLSRQEDWDPALLRYWESFGDRIGEEVPAAAVPESVSSTEVRAVRVRPDVLRSVRAQDLNIVLERLDPLAAADRFDLIIATNILVYYEPFEQSLALTNAAKMLRPGGCFVTNSGVVSTPPMTPVRYAKAVFSGRQHDYVFWYQRR